MIFIASALVMNGGTTFLIRIAREFHKRGRRCAILCLSGREDLALVKELRLYADLIPLHEFVRGPSVAGRGLLGVFMPLASDALDARLKPYGDHIHAMSVFGLLLAARIARDGRVTMSVGIYHQNEFLYKAPPFFFAREMLRLFATVPPENLVFFNESSRENYAAHFAVDYGRSALLPIGVTLDDAARLPPAHRGERIVSIGNLVGFKSYNWHIIGAVAALKDRFPAICYHIYGDGPLAPKLTELAITLGVADRVTLHGPLDYADFGRTVAECDLFVGSGTALIEAAAAGRPAMIGIESIETSETYGFLSDARGYSYNENLPHIPKRPIVEMVEELFADPLHWRHVADACADKACDFSIKVTADGFEAIAAAARPVTLRVWGVRLARLAGSAVAMAIGERIGWTESFGDRRNQSY